MTRSKAWVMTATGAPDVLQQTERNIPEPGIGQVLLRVLAAGFNPIDSKIRSGVAPVAPEHGILGCDVCGEVVAQGPGVTSMGLGDRVFGFAGGIRGRWGSYSEYMLADAITLVRVPACIPDAEAAVLPLVSITAADALQRLQLATDEQLLVLGASGGVGRMAVQMAVANGVDVTGTAGSVERCREVSALGAASMLHSDCEALKQEGRLFGAVLDTFGGSSLQTALTMTKPLGRVATINARGVHELGVAHARALTLHAVFIMIPLATGEGLNQHAAILAQLVKDLEARRIAPLPVDVRSMSEVVDVHRAYEAGELKTKVALIW